MVKRIVAMALVIAMGLQVAACGNPKTIDGITYDTYGLFNEGEKRNPDIEYRVVFGSLFWGIVGFETVILPIYCFGFDLFEPIGKKTPIKGQILR